MKVFTVGDIHGRAKALKQVLVRSKFDIGKDKLICLGDVVDGGMQSKECVDILLEIKNLTYVLGNHDTWFMNWIKTGTELPVWYHQGGINTIRSYSYNHLLVPVSHQDFFNKGLKYYVLKNMLFVHGGFNPNEPIKNQPLQDLVWDRTIIEYAKKQRIKNYKYVFIGHTTTQTQGSDVNIKNILEPIWFHNLCMMDLGAGFTGKLCIMDVNTKEFWLSDSQTESGR